MTYLPLQLLKNQLVIANKQVTRFRPTKRYKKGSHYPEAAETHYAKRFKEWTLKQQQLQSAVRILRESAWCVVERTHLRRRVLILRSYDYVLDEMQPPKKIIYIGTLNGAEGFITLNKIK